MGLYIDEDGELRENGADDTGSEYPVAPVVVPGYGGEAPTTLSDEEVEAELERFREEYKDEIPNMDGFEGLGAAGIKSVTEFFKKYGKGAINLFKKPGSDDLDWTKLLAMAGGAVAASRPNSATPTGYQGKIPKLTATSNMLTAPPVGRRPGSGGINYGGGTTYRDEAGKVISSNERTLEELRQAAINNPFNRGATYEGQNGLGQSDLATLLNQLNPKPTTPTTPTTPTAPTTPVVGGGIAAPAPGGIAAIAPRPTTPAASGNTAGLREQLRAEYASGPKTQEQLDKLLLKYSPAVMQAEFPEFGGVADYNNAAREAYQRTEQKQREENRAAMRADMERTGEEVRVANPGEGVQFSSPPSPTMSAIPQGELAAARAKLTPEQAAFIDWQMAQVNPMTGQRVADDFARQGANPYASGARAQEQIDRGVNRTVLLSQSGVSTAGIAPWTDQNWRATQQATEDAERARADQQMADYMATPEAQRTVAGPGGATAPTSGYGNYLGTPMYTPPTAPAAQAPAPAPAPAAQAPTPAAAAPAPAPVAAAQAPEPEPVPVVDPYSSYYDHMAGGYAKGGLARDGFILPADVVSHYGNGSSEAGLKLLVKNLGATPIKGDGDGMSDSIKTKIDGVQEARVANDEAYVSPEMVAKLGNGNPEKGARKLYAMMDKIRKARTGSTEQGKEIDPNKYMPGGSVQRFVTGGPTTPTGATGSESSLSNWAGDYVTNMLGQGAALANKPYEAYTGPLTAGSSGLQNQAFNMASNLRTPGSIGQAAGTAGGIANLAANMRYTPQTTDFLGGANMSGLGVAPSYGMGMPQQPPMEGTYNNPIPMPRPGVAAPYDQGPTTFSTRPMRVKQDPQQNNEPEYINSPGLLRTLPYEGDSGQGPIMLDGRGTAPQDDGGMAHVQWEGPGNPRWEAEQRQMQDKMYRGPAERPVPVDADGNPIYGVPETDFDYGPNPLQKQRPTPAGGGESFQTKPFREPPTGGTYPLPFDGGAPEMPQYGQPIQTGSRPGLRDLVTMDPSNPMYDTMYNYMQAGREQSMAGRPSEGFQTKPFQVESSEPFMQNGAMTGGTMRPPSQEAGLPGLMQGQQGMQAQQPQASQQVGNIAQQYMNPYLESALRPQMAEMQRAADIARMSDAARLTQAGAFGGSRQAIMESEGRRNLLGKQSDALAQGYSTAYDKAMAQFNADQARRAQEAQFGATFGLQGLQTGIQGAQTQGQLGAQQSQADINNLRATLEAGGVQRGIESEGIAADKAQFEEARLNPYKMVQFQQSLLSGLPLASQSYNVPGTNNLTQFAGGATTIQQLLDILSGKTTAATK